MCKFWYFIRCALFYEMEEMKMNSANGLIHKARTGDAPLIISRRPNTQKGTRLYAKILNRVVRVGFFHIGDGYRTAVNA